MTVLVAQIGARRHYAVPRAFHSQGLLERLVTDVSANKAPWCWLERTLPAHARPSGVQRLLARRVDDIPSEKIRQIPSYAISRLWDRPAREEQTDYWARRNSEFCRLVVRGGFGAADVVYAFRGAALEIFRAAKRRGCRTILDQTAASWRWNSRLLQEEAKLWPDWEDEPAEIDLSGKLTEREEQEWELSDRIVCGSRFAASTLNDAGVPRECCVVVPYPSGALPKLAPAKRSYAGNRPLRVLFVGTVQLRKGVQYLLQAARLLRGEPIAVRLVGPPKLSERVLREISHEFEVIGSVPRSDLAKHYSWADVFVLPTLSEGAANACYEAMAAGLPVITTPNAGSMVRDGIDGRIVPIRDAARLAETIHSLMTDPSYRAELGANAAAAVSQSSFSTYSTQLSSVVGGK